MTPWQALADVHKHFCRADHSGSYWDDGRHDDACSALRTVLDEARYCEHGRHRICIKCDKQCDGAA